MFSFSSGGGGLKGRSTDENKYGVYYKSTDSMDSKYLQKRLSFVLRKRSGKAERSFVVFSLKQWRARAYSCQSHFSTCTSYFLSLHNARANKTFNP